MKLVFFSVLYFCTAVPGPSEMALLQLHFLPPIKSLIDALQSARASLANENNYSGKCSVLERQRTRNGSILQQVNKLQRRSMSQQVHQSVGHRMAVYMKQLRL